MWWCRSPPTASRARDRRGHHGRRRHGGPGPPRARRRLGNLFDGMGSRICMAKKPALDRADRPVDLARLPGEVRPRMLLCGARPRCSGARRHRTQSSAGRSWGSTTPRGGGPVISSGRHDHLHLRCRRHRRRAMLPHDATGDDRGQMERAAARLPRTVRTLRGVRRRGQEGCPRRQPVLEHARVEGGTRTSSSLQPREPAQLTTKPSTRTQRMDRRPRRVGHRRGRAYRRRSGVAVEPPQGAARGSGPPGRSRQVRPRARQFRRRDRGSG